MIETHERIQALAEILVDLGFCKTIQKGNSLIKQGLVFINDLPIANTNNLVVLVGGTYRFRVDKSEKCVIIRRYDGSEENR